MPQTTRRWTGTAKSNETNEQVEDTAQLFLGLRIQCARCHHHPFEKWSQDDYYGFAAFFSRVGRKNGEAATSSRERSLPQRRHGRGRRNPQDRARRSSRPVWVRKPLRFRAERRSAHAAGRLDGRRRRTRSSPRRSSIATGSTSSAAASSSPKTTCGKRTRRRIPNCCKHSRRVHRERLRSEALSARSASRTRISSARCPTSTI